MLNYMFLGKQSAPEVYISLIPVVAGVGLATYGDYYVGGRPDQALCQRRVQTDSARLSLFFFFLQYTFLGFFLTTAGAFLAAVKGIATNTLLVGRLRLHPLDLLVRRLFVSNLKFPAFLFVLTQDLDTVPNVASGLCPMCSVRLGGWRTHCCERIQRHQDDPSQLPRTVVQWRSRIRIGVFHCTCAL